MSFGMTALVPETIVGTTATSLFDSLSAVLTTVLPYAAILVAVRVGWRFAKSFVK